MKLTMQQKIRKNTIESSSYLRLLDDLLRQKIKPLKTLAYVKTQVPEESKAHHKLSILEEVLTHFYNNPAK